MKYTQEIIINRPLLEVIGHFDNQANLYHWQPELLNFEHISGEPGKVGAQSRLTYMMGNREVEMVETLEICNLPEAFTGTYEAKGVWNRVQNRFSALDANRTKWESHCEFQFSSIGMKLMGWLMPWLFKKESYKYMRNFKDFVEGQR